MIIYGTQFGFLYLDHAFLVTHEGHLRLRLRQTHGSHPDHTLIVILNQHPLAFTLILIGDFLHVYHNQYSHCLRI